MAVSLESPRGSIEQSEVPVETESLLPLLELVDSPSSVPPKKPWLLLAVLICAMIAIVDMGIFLANPPQTRIFEANLCLGYYRETDPSAIPTDGIIPEKLCKGDVVQQRLASIFGWQDMFDAMPGIFLAVPYGTLADKVGRKWVFIASLVGMLLSFAWALMICE